MPRSDTELKTIELLGPAPCDTCRHASRCGITGEACLSFSEYARGVKTHRWQLMPKEPRRDIGDRLGFKQRQQEPGEADQAIDCSVTAARRLLNLD